MRRAKCSLCRKLIGEEDVTFFRVPQFTPKRQRWIDLTGVDFKISEYVCQDHFTPRDFINGPGESAKRARLQPGAVPSLYIPKELRSKQWRGGAAEALPEQQILPDNNDSDSEEGKSSDPTCHICKKPCPKGQVSLYALPRDSITQARWNTACGMRLKERARVCERHFHKDDFHRIGKRKRLNVNAIPSLFLHGLELTEEEAEDDDFLFQNVESIDVELIDIKPDESDEEDFSFTQYFVDNDCNQDSGSKGVQTSVADDTHTCGFIQLKAEQEIYSVHCFYCDEIFAIWDWAMFVKHIHEQHSNDIDTDQKSVLSEQPAESKKESAGSSKNKRRRSPTPRYREYLAQMTKAEPEFFAVNALPDEPEEVSPPTKDFNEIDIEEKEASAETIKKKRKNVKDTATSSDEGSDDDSDDFKSEFDEEGGKRGKTDNSRKAPLPCHQIFFGKSDHPVVMDFLELWKNYPVLWHTRSPPKDPVYAAAAAELTKNINSLRNLTITNAGMLLTLSRIRKWFRLHKSNKGNSPSCADDGNIKREYYENAKREYYDKCSEFLSKHETRSEACDKCHSFFSNAEELKEHTAKRHKQYCELCQKDFGTAAKYRKHAFKHEPPKFKCEICGKEYLRLLGLKEHMRAHRDERNFVCDKCGKKFVRQNNLNDHKKLRHPDKDNFVKRQPCAICGIDFKDWSGLCQHRRRCHMVLEGTIEELTWGIKCEYREKRKHTFVIDAVTKQRRTVCEVCGNTYARHGGLYTHMTNAHGFIPPGQRLKAAREAHSNIVKLKNEKVEETDDGKTKIRKFDGIEEIAKAEKDADDEIYDDYEFILEDIDDLAEMES